MTFSEPGETGSAGKKLRTEVTLISTVQNYAGAAISLGLRAIVLVNGREIFQKKREDLSYHEAWQRDSGGIRATGLLRWRREALATNVITEE